MSYNQLSKESNFTIYDVFKNLVDLVKQDIEIPEIVQFFYGYWHNVAIEMVSEGKTTKLTEFDKFPLIFVHADFKEKKEENSEVFAEIKPKIYIIGRTKSNYLITSRIDNVFVKILNPIYKILIKKMKSCNYFKLDYSKHKYPLIPHEKQDLYYIGSLDKNQNVLNEYVDAIELSFSNLQIKNNLIF